MEEIIIGGYTLTELKKIQTAVKKDASKVIADAIKAATDAMEEILTIAPDEDTEEEISEELSSKISELAILAEAQLEVAQVVSNVSDVEYCLPYSSEYDSDGFYYKFECAGLGDYHKKDAMYSLMGTLEDMEHASRQWNQSNC